MKTNVGEKFVTNQGKFTESYRSGYPRTQIKYFR